MGRRFPHRLGSVLLLGWILTFAILARAQSVPNKKVFIDGDAEGLDGLFSFEYQTDVLKAVRWQETIKIYTGEVNAAIEGLFAGGATEVDVADNHSGGQTLSAHDINPRAHLITGGIQYPLQFRPIPQYSALVFIGYHPMPGAENGVMSHGYSLTEIQNIWVNNRLMGEVGARTLYAGALGVPVIMVSGDAAVCKELRELVPNAECAVVKWGVSRNAGFTLSHPAACALIREKARQVMGRLGEFRPYRIDGPVEIKVELTTEGVDTWHVQPQEGVEKLDERTWVFRGKTFLEAWAKFSIY
jgi:D-amino peptidase